MNNNKFSLNDEFNDFIEKYEDKNEMNIKIVFDSGITSNEYYNLYLPKVEIQMETYKKFTYKIFYDSYKSLVNKLNIDNKICIIKDIYLFNNPFEDTYFINCEFHYIDYGQIDMNWVKKFIK